MLQKAMELAEIHLEIPQLFTSDDLLEDHVDEQAFHAYLSYFAKENPGKSAEISTELEELRKKLNQVTQELEDTRKSIQSRESSLLRDIQ